MQAFKKLLFLALAGLAAFCPAAGLDASFEGRYRVGPTSCTVTPVRMAYELRWARGSGVMNFFFETETGDGKMIFVSERQAQGLDRFEFDDRRMATGRFISADGKVFPVQKISP